MADMASEAGLPALEIDDEGGAVTVRFRHGQFVPIVGGREVSPAQRRQMILSLLDGAEDGLTRREIHERLHERLGFLVSARQVRRALEELKGSGLVVFTNRGPLTRWRRRQGAR